MIIREGDLGDRFFAIARGQVEVTTGGRFVATLGPGAYVGEIALLRDVPRTATVTARTPVLAFSLERDQFVRALSGSSATARIAEGEIGARLLGLQRARQKRRLGV